MRAVRFQMELEQLAAIAVVPVRAMLAQDSWVQVLAKRVGQQEQGKTEHQSKTCILIIFFHN